MKGKKEMNYSKEFKIEALKLSDEIGVKRLHNSLEYSITH